MRDLDGGRLRARVAVEGEEPRGAERVEREREPALIDVERVEVGPIEPTAGVGRLAERHEPEEELAHGFAARLVQPPDSASARPAIAPEMPPISP